MSLSKVFHTPPGSISYFMSVLVFKPLFNLSVEPSILLQCTHQLWMWIKSTSTDLSFVELLILVVKGQAYISSVFNDGADSRYSSVEICKQNTFMEQRTSNSKFCREFQPPQMSLEKVDHIWIFPLKNPYVSFSCYQSNHLVIIFQFCALNIVCHWIHCCHVCANLEFKDNNCRYDVPSLKSNKKSD